MNKIITDLDKLRVPSEPVKIISEQGYEKAEALDIIHKLKEVLSANTQLLSLTAPQIGIMKRVFAIRFNDVIKVFIDPIVTKKSGQVIAPETFPGRDNKEILIARPKEITAVYYTEDFKYEENKFLDAAARVFDQANQVLDGILPDSFGLVSDINQDGPLADLTEDEIKEVIDFYKKYIKIKHAAAELEINATKDLAGVYNNLKFNEGIINGRIQVISDREDKISKKIRDNKTAAKLSAAKIRKAEKTAQLSELAKISQKHGGK